jgi:tetratricopeptide (TPR) repeat protein
VLVREPDGWRVGELNLDEVQSSSGAADFLARRLELLPDDTLPLLSTGAVLGKEFELDVAGELADYTPAQVIHALDIARQRRLVWLRPDGSRCLFVHDKIRSTVLNLQPAANRLRLHARAAEFLQHHDGARAAEIAYHFDAALDPQSALPHALKAAAQARAQYALEAAEQQYQIAKRGASFAPIETRYRVAEALGEVLMLRGQYDSAGTMLEEASVLAEGTFAKAQIRGKQGELAFKRGDMEGAISCFEGALRTLGRYVPRRWPVLMLLVLWEAFVQFILHTHFPKVFVNRFKRPPSELERLSLQLFSNLAHGCWYCRSLVHVMWAHLRNMNLAERFAPTLELAQAYAEHAPGLTLVGYLSRATTYVEKSLKIREEFGDISAQGQSLHYYGVVYYAGSKYRQSIEK